MTGPRSVKYWEESWWPGGTCHKGFSERPPNNANMNHSQQVIYITKKKGQKNKQILRSFQRADPPSPPQKKTKQTVEHFCVPYQLWILERYPLDVAMLIDRLSVDTGCPARYDGLVGRLTRESEKSVLSGRLDDEDCTYLWEIQVIYIYIYIYMCVCVCVCIWVAFLH